MKLKNVSLAGLIGLLGGLVLIFICLAQAPNSQNFSQAKELIISSGMRFEEIADKLRVENFVRSKLVFEIYSLLSGRAHQLKPGRYIFKHSPSVPELVKALVVGPREIDVIIAPGMTLKEIDEKLSFLSVIKQSDLTNFDFHSLENNYPWLAQARSLEGFLLPDTYYFFVGSDSHLVVEKFLDNFELKALPFFVKRDKILQVLILASLLEKEIPDNNEQQIAAGIFIKRLATGMPLQVDASLVYIKCAGRFLNCPELSEADYKIDSPYNTYLYANWPAGPICNPGLETIKAVLQPKKSDYWYYLSDPKTQKTIFSKTLDEHNQNRAKYLLNQ